MSKFYVLLRGVNVSGKNKINMKEFVEYLNGCDIANPTYYIQSGNIIIDQIVDSKYIKKLIKDKYGYEIENFIISKEDFKKIKLANPYYNEYVDTKKLYFAFLNKQPLVENINKLTDFNIGEDKFFIKGKVIYIFYNTSAGKSKLNNSLIERKLKVSCTIRNYNTINRLIEKY